MVPWAMRIVPSWLKHHPEHPVTIAEKAVTLVLLAFGTLLLRFVPSGADHIQDHIVIDLEGMRTMPNISTLISRNRGITMISMGEVVAWHQSGINTETITRHHQA